MVTVSFPLGQVVATPAALELLEQNNMPPTRLLGRHAACDWGDITAEDAKLNTAAVADGSRILSAYRLTNGAKLWVITEAADGDGHRAATTILLPEEY